MKKIDKQAILGLRIMQRRKQLGINQSELAEQIGCLLYTSRCV